jgi:predicted RNA-binding Zn-ribbon protein involved in translation (DUF1610 family)
MNEGNEFAMTQTKSCKNCGRTFVPNWRARNFCCPSCRDAYYQKRARIRFRHLRMKTRWRLQQDPEFRSAWMARINELRAKEGRPPYWNAYENRPYTKDEVVLLIRPAMTSFEPVSQFRRHDEFRQHDEFRHNETRPALHRSEQPNKASDKRFLTFQTVLLGREYTVKISFKPDARCSHKNWRTGNIGWRNEPAQICVDCGAIKLVNEGVWRYIPDATGWIDW